MNKRGGTIGLSISLVLVGCFILSILLFANQFAVDNSAAISIADDSNLNSNLNNINASLQTYQSTNNVTVTGLYGSSIEPGSDTLSRVSTFSSGAEADALPSAMDSVRTATTSIFGDNQNILIMGGAMTGLLGLMVGLYAWKTLKAGSPD